MKAIVLLPLMLAASTLAQTNELHLLSAEPGMGQYAKCSIQQGRSTTNILLQGLSAKTLVDFKRVTQLELEVKRLTDYIKTEDKRLRAALASGPASAANDSPADQYIRNLSTQMKNLRSKEDELKEKETALAVARSELTNAARVRAVFTRQIYGGMLVWRVLPKTDATPGNTQATAVKTRERQPGNRQ